MSQVSRFAFITSLSGFKAQVYQDLYVSMTRVLDDIFNVVADRLFVVHTRLAVKRTRCLLSHMYLYFLDPTSRKLYTHLSDYYLKKHLCDMAYTNPDLLVYEFDRQIRLRFQHYAIHLEYVFRALLPEMLLSLCRLESFSPKDNYKQSRARLREIFILLQ